MNALVASPPRPLAITLEPAAPRKPRSILSRTPPMYESHQVAKKIVFDKPDCSLEETDIDDLLTETRTKGVLEIVESANGDTIVLFDDGTYSFARDFE
jgi:hypothetical protein